jgi:hypothetical protein
MIPRQTNPEPQSAREQEVTCLQATVVAPQGSMQYLVRIGQETLPAIVGAVLPTLVQGDVVVVYRSLDTDAVAIAALLRPIDGAPLQNRPITLHSGQSITLESGQTLVKLSADGLARIVAYKIENDARDLFDVDAAEVRIN